MRAHTKEPFVREPRYVVFKIKDIEKFLTEGEKNSLMCIGEEIALGRTDAGKPPFNAVVVEQDWPEFDPVWSMIEARMMGTGNDYRRIEACVNACAGMDEPEAEIAALRKDSSYLMSSETLRANVNEQRDELLEALKDLHDQVMFFCERVGEANFETGRATAAIAKAEAA